MGANHGKVKKERLGSINIQVRREPHEGKKKNLYRHNVSQRHQDYRCNYCKRQVEQYIEMDDGRKHCPTCHASAIMVKEDLEPLMDKVKEFFAKFNLTLKEQVPTYLVHESDIRNSSWLPDVDKNDKELGRFAGITLCKSTSRIQQVTGYWEREANKLEIFTETKKISCKKRECAILMLYGLPWLEAGPTLAHEMLHAWFIQQGYASYLDKEVNEGLAILVEYVWLLEQDPSSYDKHTRYFRDLLLWGVTHRAGGSGSAFKKAKQAFEYFNNDLGATIRAVCSHYGFPSVLN